MGNAEKMEGGNTGSQKSEVRGQRSDGWMIRMKNVMEGGSEKMEVEKMGGLRPLEGEPSAVGGLRLEANWHSAWCIGQREEAQG
jgi:hypothetical protein